MMSKEKRARTDNLAVSFDCSDKRNSIKLIYFVLFEIFYVIKLQNFVCF